MLSHGDFLTSDAAPTMLNFNDVGSGGGIFASGATGFVPFSFTIETFNLSLPEPGTLGLLAFGLLGAVGVRRRKAA